jgi:hypothetical protein
MTAMFTSSPRVPIKDFPDHHDAEIVMRAYELRREPVLRESRAAIIRDFLPRSWEEMQAILKGDHPLNAPFRQVSTYWEMIYGMAKHGIVHPEFLLESNGEGLILYARAKPYVAQYREASGPRAFVNSEWITTHTEMGKQMLQRFEERAAKALAAKG